MMSELVLYGTTVLDIEWRTLAEDDEDYNQGLKLALLRLREENHALDPDNIMIGNGLMNYDFNAGHGNPTYDDYKDTVDGFCMEHVMGFEVRFTFEDNSVNKY